MQPTPDTLVSAPLCSLCSKHLQTSCTGAVNLGGGFDTERKGAKERKKGKQHRSEQGCVRGTAGRTGSGRRAMWADARWDSRGWGGGQREQVSIRYRAGRVQRGGEAS